MGGQGGPPGRMVPGMACSGSLLLLNGCSHTRNAGMGALGVDVCCLGCAVCSSGRRGPWWGRVLWQGILVDGLVICRAAARAAVAALAVVAAFLLHARCGGLTAAEARVGYIICSRATKRL